jgi:hypothetical protein
MFNSEEIKCLKRRIEELEKNRFSVLELPIGEYITRDIWGGKVYSKWVPFSYKDIKETCPEGSIKMARWIDLSNCELWVPKDEFFFYSSVYSSIKEKIEAKFKEKVKK